MPQHPVHVPAELRPALDQARQAYASWLECRDVDDYFTSDEVDEFAARFTAAIDQFVTGCLDGDTDPLSVRQALLSTFPAAISSGLLDLSAYEAFDSLPPAQVARGTREVAAPVSGATQPRSQEIGTFHSVHPLSVVMELVGLGVKGQLSDGTVEVSQAGILASIFISELTADHLVVTAGNVLDTYFNFIVELSAEGTGTKGHAYLDRPFSKIKRWMGNATALMCELQSLLIEASVQFDRWDLR